MMTICPICGDTKGMTHGDQLWVYEVCEFCHDWREPIEEDESYEYDA